jgi:hypothetical protein
MLLYERGELRSVYRNKNGTMASFECLHWMSNMKDLAERGNFNLIRLARLSLAEQGVESPEWCFFGSSLDF